MNREILLQYLFAETFEAQQSALQKLKDLF